MRTAPAIPFELMFLLIFRTFHSGKPRTALGASAASRPVTISSRGCCRGAPNRASIGFNLPSSRGSRFPTAQPDPLTARSRLPSIAAARVRRGIACCRRAAAASRPTSDIPPPLSCRSQGAVACARKPRDNPSPQRWSCLPDGPVKATFVRPFSALL